MSEPSTDQAETNGVATDNPSVGAEARPEANASASSETPPPNGDTSHADTSHADASHAAEHAPSEGDATGAAPAEAEGSDESGDDGDDAEGGDGTEAETSGEALPDGTQPKKKRRRRRKKKPAGQAAGAGPNPNPNAQGGKPEKRSDRPRPHRATDRSPFHTGEEVF